MAENRIKRDSENRETKTRKRSWQRPEVLPTPEPEDGYAFRWVRVSMLGQVDATNVSSKLREGWEPVRAEDYPQFTVLNVEQERFADNIVQGGLLLCKVPQEIVDERTAYYEQQARNQIQSVDNNLMRENDARMPLFNERKTKVTFGNGT
jgi:hypothetical protein